MRIVWKGGCAIVALLALLALLAAPAAAQEAKERVWKSDGKRSFWAYETVKPVEEPKTILVEVPRGEHKEGDLAALKTVGKHYERVYYRRVPLPEPAVVKGHTCDMRVVTVLKHVEFRHFCRVDGAEKPCPGMNKAGECLAIAK